MPVSFAKQGCIRSGAYNLSQNHNRKHNCRNYANLQIARDLIAKYLLFVQ